MIAFLKGTPFYRLFLSARAHVLSDDRLRTQLMKRGHSLDKALLEKRSSDIFVSELESVLKEMGRRGLAPGETVKWVWELIYQARFGGEPSSAAPDSPAAPESHGELPGAIRGRRSIRFWTDAPVDPEAVARAVDTAKWAPSSCNRQPWLFLALTDKEDKAFLTRFTPQTFFANAPLVLAVLVDLPVYEPMEYHFAFLDAGAAIQNLLLALHGEGLGACWVGVKYKSTFDENAAAFRARFGHDARYKLVSFIAVGHSAKQSPAPPRKPLEAIFRAAREE